jgi:hypothetical protein
MIARVNRGRKPAQQTQNDNHQYRRFGRARLASLDGGNLAEGRRVVIAVDYPVVHRAHPECMRSSRDASPFAFCFPNSKCLAPARAA